MSNYSQHPEVPIPHELAATAERVVSGIERVVVLTAANGDARVALVSLGTLRELDRLDALVDGDEREEEDRVGLKVRSSDADSPGDGERAPGSSS